MTDLYSPLVEYQGIPRSILGESRRWGINAYDLAGPVRRLYSDGAEPPALVEQYVDEHRVTSILSPAVLLADLPHGDTWLAQSSRSLARLQALFLIAEDPQQRLVGRVAATLAHQISLVRFVLSTPDLRRVLIADEVGLGKTIEAGLIVKGVLEQQPGARVLYLAPARLVPNVYKEFRTKLDLPFRMYSADFRSQADIEADPLVIASIHKAIHQANREKVLGTHPWDVLIIDECHHLSARGEAGQEANEHYRLVRDLISRQPSESRVLLLSGTPHQGNRQRFENLLLLLLAPDEKQSAVRGRVIFRTKDRVRDWAGKPLFPGRQVRQPRVVELGDAYREWYEAIATLYDQAGNSDASRRASAWAKGQALQWAASSVQAGLGYLVRMAIRRQNWDLTVPELKDGLAALRPYRNGAPDEPLDDLFGRIRREIGQQQLDQSVEDLEEIYEEPWRPDGDLLRAALTQGRALLGSSRGLAKWEELLTLLKESKHEKVVLFAQPIETVVFLAKFLTDHTGVAPAVVIGGQTDGEREAAIRHFQKPEGPRFLLSSRAGGEGINLQVSRRLIHLDVPWNPMEMEQRVGRVHRFGSRQTILVDTLVVAGTREVDAYRVAREKLAIACGDLVHDEESFEALFARVMSLVPPQALDEVMGKPMLGDNANRLGALVQEGLDRWREFHKEFAAQQKQLQDLDPGAASWEDLASFLIEQGNAKPVDSATMPDFVERGDEIIAVEAQVPALAWEGSVFVCGNTNGAIARTRDGREVAALGLNTPAVTNLLRQLSFPSVPTGSAWLRLRARSGVWDTVPSSANMQFGVLAFVRQSIRTAVGNTSELSVALVLSVVSKSGELTVLSREAAPALVRELRNAVRQKEPSAQQLAQWKASMANAERTMLGRLGPETEAERAQQIRHAVWPVFAAVITED